MSMVWVDDKTWKVNVKHAPSEGFLPSEESIAIEKYAKMIKDQLDEFLSKKHKPMVDKLLKMVAEYNYKNNSEYRQQMDELRKQREKAREDKKPAPPKPGKSKKKSR